MSPAFTPSSALRERQSHSASPIASPAISDSAQAASAGSYFRPSSSGGTITTTTTSSSANTTGPTTPAGASAASKGLDPASATFPGVGNLQGLAGNWQNVWSSGIGGESPSRSRSISSNDGVATPNGAYRSPSSKPYDTWGLSSSPGKEPFDAAGAHASPTRLKKTGDAEARQRQAESARAAALAAHADDPPRNVLALDKDGNPATPQLTHSRAVSYTTPGSARDASPSTRLSPSVNAGAAAGPTPPRNGSPYAYQRAGAGTNGASPLPNKVYEQHAQADTTAADLSAGMRGLAMEDPAQQQQQQQHAAAAAASMAAQAAAAAAAAAAGMYGPPPPHAHIRPPPPPPLQRSPYGAPAPPHAAYDAYGYYAVSPVSPELYGEYPAYAEPAPDGSVYSPTFGIASPPPPPPGPRAMYAHQPPGPPPTLHRSQSTHFDYAPRPPAQYYLVPAGPPPQGTLYHVPPPSPYAMHAPPHSLHHKHSMPHLHSGYGEPIYAPQAPANFQPRGGGGGGGAHSRHPHDAHDPAEGLRSPLLEEFRANKNKRHELRDIFGYIVEFSGDQHGSRFIQQKLETATTEEKERVFDEILPNALQLSSDVFGNYVIQKLFEYGSQVQKTLLAKQMEGNVFQLSFQMYGCRVVQKALEHVLVEQQIALVKELDSHILKAVRDQNANHVIQRIIERVAPERLTFVSAFKGHVYELSTHPYGCRVLQRCFEHLEPEQTRPLIDELHVRANQLMLDMFGNYVIQFLLEHGSDEDRRSIVAKVRGQILQLARHKFASNVCEKALVMADPSDRRSLIDEIAEVKQGGNSQVLALMKDQYGNYVLQRAVSVALGEQLDDLIAKIRPHLANMRKFSNSYSKHLMAIERLVNSRQPPPPPTANGNGPAPPTGPKASTPIPVAPAAPEASKPETVVA